jgi:hypothetical protein
MGGAKARDAWVMGTFMDTMERDACGMKAGMERGWNACMEIVDKENGSTGCRGAPKGPKGPKGGTICGAGAWTGRDMAEAGKGRLNDANAPACSVPAGGRAGFPVRDRNHSDCSLMSLPWRTMRAAWVSSLS